MFKKILGALAALSFCATPVSARVDDNTVQLLELIEEGGIQLVIDDGECKRNQYAGMYLFNYAQRLMRICTGSRVDAFDHDTVRHEVWHAIQHCRAYYTTGRHTLLPVIVGNFDVYEDFIINTLSPELIQEVMRTYPEDRWVVELEAFAVAQRYTATEMMMMFRKECMK